MSLTFVVCLALFAEAQEPNPLWDSVLTNCSGTYRLTVTAREDYTTLDITYNGESGKSIAIAHYKGERGFLYAWPISVIPNAVVGVWECGTGSAPPPSHSRRKPRNLYSMSGRNQHRSLFGQMPDR